MEIKEAVKKVMEKEGAKIISSPDFIKLLSRRKVFTDHPEYKKIIKSIQLLGFDMRLLDIDSDDKELGVYSLSDIFEDKTSFNHTDIYDVFQAIGCGLSLIKNRKLLYSEPKSVNKIKPKVSSTTDIFETENSEEQSYSGESLPSIIRYVVKKEGPSIILEPRFINILNDLRAFESSTVHRFILKSIQSEGFGRSLLSVKKWELQGETLCLKFVSQTGSQQKEVKEVFQSLAYGLGYIDSIPASSNEDSPVHKTSQINQTHLTIKSIPIDGNINDFINKLKAKGATEFTGINPKYCFASVKLTFMRQDDCILWVNCTYISRTVYKAELKFPDASSWWVLSNTYLECKDTLTKKYGNPQQCPKSFRSEFNKYKEDYLATNEKHFVLESVYRPQAGMIRLYIFGMQVNLEYTDTANENLVSKENKQAAFDDL